MLLRSAADMLSNCASAIKAAAEQHCLPSSAHERAALQCEFRTLREQNAYWQFAAVDMLCCLREPALHSSIDVHQLLDTLGQLIGEVKPTAGCDQSCSLC